jgi:hypothetical protein
MDPKQATITGEACLTLTHISAEHIKAEIASVSNLFNSIECSTCHAIIYTPKGKFDQDTFKANKEKHYSESPSCKPIRKKSDN